MFEYAISDGEGTLIDYGINESDSFPVQERGIMFSNGDVEFYDTFGFKCRIAPCDPDCQTGK